MDQRLKPNATTSLFTPNRAEHYRVVPLKLALKQLELKLSQVRFPGAAYDVRADNIFMFHALCAVLVQQYVSRVVEFIRDTLYYGGPFESLTDLSPNLAHVST